MASTSIRVDHLYKYYKVRRNTKSSYQSLREEMVYFANRFFNSTSTAVREKKKFSALENVSFDIEQGKVMGVIGRNGAGKSTLLKILARITYPSQGVIKLRGKVSSLLEVGTGFHPELTGRENVFLSGSILGMKQAEVNKYFDDIVQFAGIEQFLDLPVKRYSSGMFVRLGFAIAAHLQSEILLIDEVLAVGDLEFQKRCLGKIGEVASSGKTVLFVSHNLGAVEQLCDSCLVLDQGQVKFNGALSEGLKSYINLNRVEGKSYSFDVSDHFIKNISLSTAGKKSNIIMSGASFEIEVLVHLEQQIKKPVLGIVIRDRYNIPIVGINNRHYGEEFKDITLKTGIFRISIPHCSLVPGSYNLDLYLGDIHQDFEVIENAYSFLVQSSNQHSLLISKLDKRLNKVLLQNVSWEVEQYEQ